MRPRPEWRAMGDRPCGIPSGRVREVVPWEDHAAYVFEYDDGGKLMSKKKPFANTPLFYTALGLFHATWSQTELTIDCAMWKALGGTETPEQAHERSARTKFSDKYKDFRTLLDGNKTSHSEKVKHLLTQIENYGRNALTHSFLARRAFGDVRPSEDGT
jgi:hypothetical protein